MFIRAENFNDITEMEPFTKKDLEKIIELKEKLSINASLAQLTQSYLVFFYVYGLDKKDTRKSLETAANAISEKFYGISSTDAIQKNLTTKIALETISCYNLGRSGDAIPKTAECYSPKEKEDPPYQFHIYKHKKKEKIYVEEILDSKTMDKKLKETLEKIPQRTAFYKNNTAYFYSHKELQIPTRTVYIVEQLIVYKKIEEVQAIISKYNNLEDLIKALKQTGTSHQTLTLKSDSLVEVHQSILSAIKDTQISAHEMEEEKEGHNRTIVFIRKHSYEEIINKNDDKMAPEGKEKAWELTISGVQVPNDWHQH